MGGRIDFQSEAGKGSTFHVAVKLSYDAIGGMVLPQWQGALAGMRVMIIEPHAGPRAMPPEVGKRHGTAGET